MKPGPKPQPTHLTLLKNNPGHRPINDKEPKPRPIAPKCPSWLHKYAKTEWRVRAKQLDALGLLTEIDGTAFAAYCQKYAEWREATEFLIAKGTVFPIRHPSPGLDENGKPILGGIKYLQQVPQVAIASKALAHMRAFLQEFGMTPSARTGLSVPEKEIGNDNIFDT